MTYLACTVAKLLPFIATRLRASWTSDTRFELLSLQRIFDDKKNERHCGSLLCRWRRWIHGGSNGRGDTFPKWSSVSLWPPLGHLSLFTTRMHTHDRYVSHTSYPFVRPVCRHAECNCDWEYDINGRQHHKPVQFVRIVRSKRLAIIVVCSLLCGSSWKWSMVIA